MGGGKSVDIEFLHQTPVSGLEEEIEGDVEEFLNQEAWPIVEDLLADIGVQPSRDYKIRLIDEDDNIDAAGEAGSILDLVNGERAIRINPDTDWTVYPLLAHEGAHKYIDELLEPAKEITQDYSVLTTYRMYLEAGTTDDFQYAALAHQAPERMRTIAALAEQEKNRWDENASKQPEESRAYDEAIENRNRVSGLLRGALQREMELQDIDQEEYEDMDYHEGFTMAVLLFAGSSLERDGWEAFLQSDHLYAEGEKAEIIEKVYQRAQDANGSDRERMRTALELQDKVYRAGKNLLS